MYKVRAFLLTDLLYLKVFLAFSLGILLAEYLPIFISFCTPFFIFFVWLLLYKLLSINKPKWKDSLFFSLIVLVAILFHSSNLLKIKNTEEQILSNQNRTNTHYFRLDEKPILKENSIKIEGVLLDSNSNNFFKWQQPKIIVYIPKNNQIPLSYGTIYQIYGQLKLPSQSQYCFEFDYKKWLYRHGIAATIFSKNIQKIAIDSSIYYQLKSFPKKVRDYYEMEIDHFVLNPTSNAIAKSILLGIRSDIDKELYNAYSNTGTIHILSVSGLHFGLLFLFIKMLLTPIPISDKGKFAIKHIISLLYALMTGFSPPVIRSFLMFLFLDISKLTRIKTSFFNILFLSAWLILLFDTQQLFDIGFQLSYVAILGIMILYNKIIWLVEFKNYWLTKIWEMTVTMICAWIVTIPLTVFYFHKFSFAGMLSNFIVLPIITASMNIGFLLMLFSKISILAKILGAILSTLIYWQNYTIELFSTIRYSHFSGIYLNLIETITLSISIVFLIVFFISKEKYSLRLFLLLSFTFVVITSFNFHQERKNKAWYILPDRKNLSFCFVQNKSIYIFTNNSFSPSNAVFLDNIKAYHHTKYVKISPLHSHFKQMKMYYGTRLKDNPKYFVFCKENKNIWEQALSKRDSFVLHSSTGWIKEDLLKELKFYKKTYLES